MPKLRLKEVRVQPVFVLDDGENLADVIYGQDTNGNPITDHPPVTIPANEWPTYSGERFPREVREWQQKIDADSEGEQRTKPKRTRPRR